MSRDHLGLFDTPPDRKQIRFAVGIVVLVCVAGVAILPVSGIRLWSMEPFVPVIDAVMAACEFIIATILYAQVSISRSRALTVLATGYVFIAVLLVPHALTFPGAFAPNGLLDAGVNTTAWIASFRRDGFPLVILFYAALKRVRSETQAGPDRRAPRIGVCVFAGIATALALTLLAIFAQASLPPLFINGRDADYTNLMVANIVTIALTISAMVLLFWRGKSVLDLWLQVALAAWLVQTLLNLHLDARFTVGWYFLFVLMLVSSFVVMLALLAESTRLYQRLALSTAARERERDARLMSMDAVAAAISHEVGQPLSAIVMSATAGLKLLDREHPDVEKAMASLRATIEAGNRSFDVLKSIRAMFSKGSRTTTEVDLNELVRETAALLDRELVGGKVSLELALDDALPPVVADRVQMQQVLVNLLINAMEAMGTGRSRPRRIAVRSVALDERDVLLEVSDTGKGIAPEDLPQIFDAFYTTKPTGTGLGLSLCRTIVEGHGGRLWASPGEKHGAIFHLQLPRAALLAS